MAKFDVYEEVTNQIVCALEAGTPPWRKPWTGDAVATVFQPPAIFR
jgi:antirestriction protein ArdC